MIIIHKEADITKQTRQLSASGKRIGFVPTMGALHEGHLSLLQEAQQKTDFVVVSIFVNPTQFNDPKDFEKYPVTLETDILKLENAGCDLLFLPDIATIYPKGTKNPEIFELGSLEVLLEGAYRPGHFQGVCQVMHRLLTLVQPDLLFMGEKDFQQCMVVQRLIGLKNLPVKLVTCATLREEDGLAMSSRNMRLQPKERKQAITIFKTMDHLAYALLKKASEPEKLINEAREELLKNGFDPIDYVAIAHPDSLQPYSQKDQQAGLPAVILVAAYLGEVRLIDNVQVP